MKWTNKGHQFDETGKAISHPRTIYLYGAGELGGKMRDVVNWLHIKANVMFVDSNRAIKQCIPLQQFIVEFNPETAVVIICFDAYSGLRILSKIPGIEYRRNAFSARDFIWFYLPLMMKYCLGKMFCPSAAVFVSNKCNLRCGGCGIFVDKHQNPADRDFNSLAMDIDLIFERFDYVYEAGTSGGELLLYPRIGDVMRRFATFSPRMFSCGITTNATMSPSDDLISAYCTFPERDGTGIAKITIDDYGATVKCSKAKDIAELARKHGIMHIIQRHDNWVDFGIDKTDNSSMTDEQLTTFHDCCQNTCWWVSDGKMYTCGFVKSYSAAGFIAAEKNDYCDLKTATDMEIVEFMLGCTERGFFELCKRCNGYLTINRNKMPVALQSKRKDDYSVKA
jgi:organic radical activating enzyme